MHDIKWILTNKDVFDAAMRARKAAGFGIWSEDIEHLYNVNKLEQEYHDICIQERKKCEKVKCYDGAKYFSDMLIKAKERVNKSSKALNDYLSNLPNISVFDVPK